MNGTVMFMAPKKKSVNEKVEQISVGFTKEQLKFIRRNNIDIQRFCRHAMDYYIDRIKCIKELLNG